MSGRVRGTSAVIRSAIDPCTWSPRERCASRISTTRWRRRGMVWSVAATKYAAENGQPRSAAASTKRDARNPRSASIDATTMAVSRAPCASASWSPATESATGPQAVNGASPRTPCTRKSRSQSGATMMSDGRSAAPSPRIGAAATAMSARTTGPIGAGSRKARITTASVAVRGVNGCARAASPPDAPVVTSCARWRRRRSGSGSPSAPEAPAAPPPRARRRSPCRADPWRCSPGSRHVRAEGPATGGGHRAR